MPQRCNPSPLIDNELQNMNDRQSKVLVMLIYIKSSIPFQLSKCRLTFARWRVESATGEGKRGVRFCVNYRCFECCPCCQGHCADTENHRTQKGWIGQSSYSSTLNTISFFRRMQSNILADTSSILLYLFLRNIFVMSDIKIKEENLFCDNIKGNEIFPAQQVSKWNHEGSTVFASPCFKDRFLWDLVSF